MHPREVIAGVECTGEFIMPSNEFPGLSVTPDGSERVNLNDLVRSSTESDQVMRLAREYGYVVLHDVIGFDDDSDLRFVGSAWQQVATEWHADFYSSGTLAGILLAKVDDKLPRDDTGIVGCSSFIEEMRVKRGLFDHQRQAFTEIGLPKNLQDILERLYSKLGSVDDKFDVFELLDRFYVRLFRFAPDSLQCVKDIHREITDALTQKRKVYAHRHNSNNAIVIDNLEKREHPNGPNMLHCRLLGTRTEAKEVQGDLRKGYIVSENGQYIVKPRFP